ncbi:MAG: cyanophycin synthetase [Pseudanabaenaceae cyanobacterium]
MKILKVLALRGPNVWSIQRANLIVLRLDVGDPPKDLTAFQQGLCRIFPRLAVRPPSSVPSAVQEVAQELQRLAEMPVAFGTVKPTAMPQIYQVVFEYQYEQAGRYAARAAVRLCQSLLETGLYPEEELQQDLTDLRELRLECQLGPSTKAIVNEAKARRIPWLELGTRAMIQLGYGVYQKRIQATLTDRTGVLAVELASDKEGTKQILRDSGIPVPKGTVISNVRYLEEAIEDVGGFPIVVKPLNGNHGRGISVDVRDLESAHEAFLLAQDVSRQVIIERFHRGRDHRILVINGKVVAVAERVPAHVVGDGISTISQLIETTNQDPRRGDGHDNVLTKIVIDRTSEGVLARQGWTLDSVPPAGQICYLRATANLSTGGISVDRTDEIHPENVWIAERVAKIIGLDIAGIDVVTPDIARPFRETDSAIVEVNAAPGFRMHTAPSMGMARNVAEPLLDMLFPPGTPCRVPIVSITGTNGKTTTTRLTAHIFRRTGKVVGYTTTDGIYIGDWLVEKGDTTGPRSAQVILRDPTVEIAVLETARGGIIRSGLGFDACDVGIVLNVQADHLGSYDIETIAEMANVKSVVAQAVCASGYAILNADDPLVSAMATKVKGQVAYFSLQEDSPIVRAHVQQGGLAAVYEHGYLSILKGDWTLRIEQAVNIPLTMGGKVSFQIQNALAASLAGFCQGIRIEDIRVALTTFDSSAHKTPGRMNLFDLGKLHVLVDYAHNPASFVALGEFIGAWQGQKIGVIGAPGDRRNLDITELGRLAGKMFDRIYIKEDQDLRGRAIGEVAEILYRAVQSVNPELPCTVILDELTALETAMTQAETGALVAIFPEKVDAVLKVIEKRLPSPAHAR